MFFVAGCLSLAMFLLLHHEFTRLLLHFNSSQLQDRTRPNEKRRSMKGPIYCSHQQSHQSHQSPCFQGDDPLGTGHPGNQGWWWSPKVGPNWKFPLQFPERNMGELRPRWERRRHRWCHRQEPTPLDSLTVLLVLLHFRRFFWSFCPFSSSIYHQPKKKTGALNQHKSPF